MADRAPGRPAGARPDDPGAAGTAGGLAVRPLDSPTWPDFARLVELNNGVFGGCWCMGFHPEGVGKDTTAALDRERKLARVATGAAHAALVDDGTDCVGWCQFGSPAELPRIKSRAAYERGWTTLPDWRIACCFVGTGHRRRGVASAGLAGALELIAAHGGGVVGLSRGRRHGGRRGLDVPCPTLHLYAQPAAPEYLEAQESYASRHLWFRVWRLDARSHVPMFEVPDEMAAGITDFVGSLRNDRAPGLADARSSA